MELKKEQRTSQKEQLTFVLSYVPSDAEKHEYVIKESFIEFVIVIDSTGQGIAEVALEKLDKFGLDIADMRGQGYDNGANMSGKYNGVQKRILDLNPLAAFIPCSNRSLNLNLKDMASASGEINAFFLNVQEIFTFLSASSRRWDVLIKHCSSFKDLTPELLSTTRWSARHNAIKPLRRNLRKVLAALEEICNDETFDKFVCSVCIWNVVLEQFERVAKSLQKIDSNLATAVMLLQDLDEFLASYKLDGYDKAIQDAVVIAEENDIPLNFEIP